LQDEGKASGGYMVVGYETQGPGRPGRIEGGDGRDGRCLSGLSKQFG